MPLHDWSRVGDNVFHSFHGGWIYCLMRALNQEILPEGYQALSEEYVGPYQADVLTLEVGGSEPPASGVATAPEPTATIAPPHFGARRQRRLTIFAGEEERRVAVVEIVSAGNKDSAARAGWFEAKLVDYLASGLHLLVVDPLAPTRPAPGIAAAVAQELGAQGSVPQGGRCVTSFERCLTPDEVRIYHQHFVLEEPLPDAPLFLDPGLLVEVPLEETYLEALAALPAAHRRALVS